MWCMVICGYDYAIFSSVVRARKWGREAVKVFHESADIHRLERDGSMGALYDIVRYEEDDRWPSSSPAGKARLFTLAGDD